MKKIKDEQVVTAAEDLLKEFANIRKVGKIAISIVEGDELISVQLSNGNDQIIIASHEGKCIRFNESDVRAMGRDTQGVRSMNLNDGDYVVDEKAKTCTLTPQGVEKAERYFNIENLNDADNITISHHIQQAIKA